ncbi:MULTISPECIES: hypothetical protein [unclassified Caballeronia]|uniref:hypothetical protein n=1 Tax=unclassified Caballeronia TaxID=2646786 RepID=UPI001F41C15C|nr:MULTISPECIES: hypothetical protein [unclassified Caballeronia]MCE4543225.1 hypothetical protein [Caballeronia sp. PC1]MCE4567720.1 hypothetical protein [Caballeronia sp. CLC5]
MEENSSVIAQYHSFHDWYLCGVSADMFNEIVELKLMFDDRKSRVRLRFNGATRCLVRDFLIQNIIHSVDVLTDYASPEFKQARSTLDGSYPWGKDKPPKPIASVSASIGADLLVEFESLDVDPE